MKDVSSKTRTAHIRFIQANWELLAALAYQGALNKGKGMLFLQDDPFIGQPVGKIIRFGAVFVSEGSPEFIKAGGKWPGEKETQWIATYQPETTMLVCFVRSDNGQSSYRLLAPPGNSPLECYHRIQAKQN